MTMVEYNLDSAQLNIWRISLLDQMSLPTNLLDISKIRTCFCALLFDTTNCPFYNEAIATAT